MNVSLDHRTPRSPLRRGGRSPTLRPTPEEVTEVQRAKANSAVGPRALERARSGGCAAGPAWFGVRRRAGRSTRLFVPPPAALGEPNGAPPGQGYGDAIPYRLRFAPDVARAHPRMARSRALEGDGFGLDGVVSVDDHSNASRSAPPARSRTSLAASIPRNGSESRRTFTRPWIRSA